MDITHFYKIIVHFKFQKSVSNLQYNDRIKKCAFPFYYFLTFFFSGGSESTDGYDGPSSIPGIVYFMNLIVLNTIHTDVFISETLIYM